MAAWGAIQKIIAAIDRFIAFLKAVKSGGAGPAFANALAAAAVAVIEFVSQFLLRKIAGAAGKVAGKIKAIAQKIGKRLMKVVKKVGKGLKKVGKKIKRGATRLKDKVFGKKKQSKKDKKDAKQDKQDRLDKAVRELTPKVRALVDKGVGKLRMKAQLAFWKLRYRLSSLEITGAGKAVGIRAKVNPEADLIRNVIVTSGSLLHEQVDRVWPIVQRSPKVQDAVRKMRDQRAAKFEDKTDEQTKEGRNIKGPYNRGEVDETGVPGASQIDVGTGSKIGENGIDRPNRSMEQHNFLVDQHGKPLVSTSEKQENTGPGGIMVTGGGTYHKRIEELQGLSSQDSMSMGEGILALQSGRPLPQGVDPKKVAEFARLNQVEGGRDKGSFVALQMMAQLMAQGKVTAAEGLLQHQMSPIGAMDIARNSDKILERQENVRQALADGRTPAKKDEKLPWRGPRKWKQDGEKQSEPWPEAMDRFWDREKRAVVLWLETRMLVEPYLFATEERFMQLLKKDMPEYLADHIIKGTMQESPAAKATFTTKPSDDTGLAGATTSAILGG